MEKKKREEANLGTDQNSENFWEEVDYKYDWSLWTSELEEGLGGEGFSDYNYGSGKIACFMEIEEDIMEAVLDEGSQLERKRFRRKSDQEVWEFSFDVSFCLEGTTCNGLR